MLPRTEDSADYSASRLHRKLLAQRWAVYHEARSRCPGPESYLVSATQDRVEKQEEQPGHQDDTKCEPARALRGAALCSSQLLPLTLLPLRVTALASRTRLRDRQRGLRKSAETAHAAQAC